MNDCGYLVEVVLPVPLTRSFTYRWPAEPPADRQRPRRGDLVVVPFGRRREVVGLVTELRTAEPDQDQIDGNPLKDVARVLPAEYCVTGERLRLARWLADYYALPLGEVVPLLHPPAPGTQRRDRTAAADAESYPDVDVPDIRLTAAQQAAVSAATDLLTAETFGALLLHGVTGSGKTEVYLTVIEQALAAGRGAVFLLPEIALTPQTLARIKARFGDRVAALHSGLSAGQRCSVHERAARGELSVVVGPRSALFTPIGNLGVIIVDEEHDTSYKQDEKPRYHARHAALIRGRENRAVVMLGSATPDLESMNNATAGRYRLLELPDRLGGELPPVEIVDMRGRPSADGFSPELTEALEETLDGGRQAILYYNRRGFARVMQCGDCGRIYECPNCDIGLTYHLRPRRLLCHYCGHTAAVPRRCDDCGGERFLPGGGGTEKLELHLQAQFPEARLLRLDHDTTRRRGSHKRILSAFARREADILVGTQMVAKGHHFPGVELVGVLAADDGLAMPDYRSAERSFQLLTQVAGRAGRTGAGRVIFQTYRPDDPIIQAAARHDFGAFLELELPIRQALSYPPFGRLIRLGISGRRLGAVREAAQKLADALQDNLAGPGLSLLGPAPAVFPRLKDRYRYQILIKGRVGLQQKAWLAACLRSLKESYRGVDVVHDIDPLSVY